MKVLKIVNGIVATNSYIVFTDTNCVVIDPATEEVYIRIIKEGLKADAVLLTHGHFDHIGGVNKFMEKSGCEVFISAQDNDKCNGAEMAERLIMANITPFNATSLLSGDEELTFGDIKIKVLSTPGHSKGSVCYIIGDFLFCGDTLFKDGYGRYDFYDGNLMQLKDSIKKLFALNKDYKVYCGHDEDTTLLYEKKGNPILWW